MHVARFRLAAVVAGVLAAGPAFAFSVKVTPQLAAYDDAPALQGGVPATVTVASAGWFDDAAMTVAGTDCAVNGTAGCTKYASGTVTLTATNGANTTFVGWAGCNSVAGNVCTVNATADRNVVAQFKPAAYTFRVATSPRPTATWTPSYGGTITVGAAAAYRSPAAAPGYAVTLLPAGVPVVVTATPDAGSQVKAWTGCTPATPTATTCTVTPYAPTALTVAFTAPPASLVRVSTAGNGAVRSGAVATAPDYTNCRAYTGDCEAIATVDLVAVPDAGSKFAGWTGCNSNPTPTTCRVTASAFVSATFKAALGTAGSCVPCHGQPATHGANAMDCFRCHNSTLHLNNVSDPVANPFLPKPDGEIIVDITSVSTTATAVASVTFTVKDAKTNAFVAGLTPTVHLGKLLADGTYRSYYKRAATGANYIVGGVTKTPTLASANQDRAAAGTTTYNATTGEYTFTFTTNTDGSGAVADADKALTHTVALYTTKTQNTYNFRGFDSFSFVPNVGGAEVPARAVVTDAACNACHGQLQLHGQRRGVANCLVCHNPTTIDPETGSSVDMATMVHKIHNGHLLENGYEVVGYQQSYFDFGHVMMAPSHGGYLEGAGKYSTAHDPGLSRECSICHGTALTNGAYTKPSRRACGACHDDLDFTQTHGGGIAAAQPNDSLCAGCHPASGSNWSIEKTHSKFYASGMTNEATPVKYGVDFRSDITPGVPATGHLVEAKIVNVENVNDTTSAGCSVTTPCTVKYTVQVKIDGTARNPSTLQSSAAGADDGYVLSTCAFTVAGPNSDYTYPITGNNTGGSCTTPANWVATATAGEYAYNTATNPFAGKTGKYTVAMEFMVSRQWSPVAAADRIRKPFAADPNFVTVDVNAGSVTVLTGAAETLAARRKVVDYDKCNDCHEDLGFHSNRGRQGPDYCATCHNPVLDNSGRARFTVAEAYTVPTPTGTTLGYLPESVSLNVFIHRIHMGKRLPSIAGAELLSTANTGAALRSPLVADQVGAASIRYGATRSNFVGVDASTPPEIADFTGYAQPDYMNRCEQCHIDTASKQTWALPELPGLSPVKRYYRSCSPTRPTWATEDWCNVTINTGAPATGVVVNTPPLKAVCTSCHDSLATDQHADLFTVNPMTAGATELCAGCHGAGKSFDSLDSHRRVP